MKIVMPKLGLTMKEATLTRWLKEEGDPIEEGDVLFEFEGDKAALEYEAPAAGVLSQRLVDEGTTVPCGEPVAILEASRRPREGFTLATPVARRRARELGVDLAAVNGRGPAGRIHLADVEEAAQVAAQQAAQEPSIPATPVARRLAADLGLDLATLSGTGPGGRVTREDVVQTARRQLNEALANASLAGEAKPSFNTLFIAIVARALRHFPRLNACLVDDEIRLYEAVNVALAVDTERGLLAPVIRDADRLDFVAIQRESEALIARALAGTSRPEELSGGTFTITNLGAFDVDGFTPIINQPQAAILGIGRIAPRPAGVDGQKELLPWLKTVLWPIQEAMTPDDVRLASLLGLAENVRWAKEKSLLKRIGSPEDVARTVIFLSEMAFATGTVYFIDGGRGLV